MREAFRKILSFFMAFIVMISTMSFIVDLHYCGETLVDKAIFHTVETCGMDMENPLVDGCSIEKESCCSDEQLVLDGQDELQQSANKITFEQQVFIASFIYTHINLFEGLEKEVIPFRDYKPPFLIRDFQKIHETYLI